MNDEAQTREQLIEKVAVIICEVAGYDAYDGRGGSGGCNWEVYKDDAAKAISAAHQSATEQMKPLVEACNELRDSVLNWRHQLEEGTIDSDQTNAVLGLFDDTVGQALATIEKGD